MAISEDTARWLDDDVIAPLAHSGDPVAIAEAERRGIDYPPAVEPNPADGAPTGYSDRAFGDPVGHDSDVTKLPVESLIWLRDEGNKDAAAELHRRYPYTYDETGEQTEASVDADRKTFPSMY